MQKRGDPLVFGVWTRSVSVSRPQEYGIREEQFRGLGERAVVRILGKRDEDLWAHPTDQHPNHIGQRLIASGIREWLRRERIGP